VSPHRVNCQARQRRATGSLEASKAAAVLTEILAASLKDLAMAGRRLPIGIDEIACTITYRELFKRDCLTKPVFETPLDLRDLD
jgi:hypothetical protein